MDRPDPELIEGIERAVAESPGNRALRLHLVELLLSDGQPAAALGNCERLLRADAGDPAAAALRDRAQSELAGRHSGPTEPPSPTAPPAPGERLKAEDPGAVSDEELFEIVRPKVSLDDVGGMEAVKERLRLGFLEPLRNEELRQTFGHSMRAGLLLWGPPGCGKTFLARALAGELGLYFIHVGIADVLDMWVGSSERNVRRLFDEARRAAPAVLFIDELDALGHRRAHMRHDVSGRNVVNQLLVELDGAESDNTGLLVLGATNQPWEVDEALIRPGRFDRQVLVLPPDEEARAAILALHLRDRPVGAADLAGIAARTEGLSGADLARLCERAVELAMYDSARTGVTRLVSQADLEKAVADTAASTGAWFATANNHAQFANDDGRYDELLQYVRSRKRRR